MALELLVVDRDPVRRARLVEPLRAAGHRVAATGDALEAVDALTARLDALVLDLTLPGLDNAALREAIRPTLPAVPESLEAIERRHIAHTLDYTHGNRRQAALLLGIARSTLLQKLRRYGLG